MERIASFEVNHLILKEGIYLSRIDGDVYTYDLRLKIPNGGDYLENAAIHTTEHLFATYVRNSEFKDSIIYFGPMGCRTGFYFLVKDLSGEQVIALCQRAFAFIAGYDGDIPGASAIECGNYLDHNLEGAKRDAEKYLKVLDGYTADRLSYAK